ncbi:hypothetical protein DY000_02024476 [Brassica cretica]|uniref:Uncharacterized protein n=1 Tax=Brassica cretica TaxID=69181 RepID=A0ABQ7EHY4_BRACR|nr:hypothetical protein DY000_02024476 [Brassica cretica]
MNIFKKKTTPKDALRTSKREMAVATRGIEREISSLQLEAATKILARQLVRLRQQITNLQGSRAQIRGVTTHTQALYASTSISSGMKGATKAMVAMNKVLDEIGVGVASQLSSAPKGRIATKTAAPPATTATTINNNSSESSEVDELERRLASLRRI